jgi:gliding motility-associated-like protein
MKYFFQLLMIGFYLLNCTISNAQQFVNGGLEAGIQDCKVDISNNTFSTFMPAVEGIGPLEKLDIYTYGCNEGVPREGENFIAIQSELGISDAVALALTEDLVFGEKYYLQFWARKSGQSKGDFRLALGMNPTPDSNGELLYTTSDLTGEWKRFEISFTGSIQALFITCLIEGGEDVKVYLDGFSFGCPQINLGEDQMLCEERDVEINAGDAFETYRWSTGETGAKLTVSGTGIYGVTATLGNCKDSDEIAITVDPYLCNCRAYIPNSFSPNNDGINDIWTFSTTCITLMKEASIYDRWGNLVYHNSSNEISWDGRHYKTSENLVAGVYTCIIRYSVDENGYTTEFVDITLIR